MCRQKLRVWLNVSVAVQKIQAIVAWHCIYSVCMIVTLALPDPHPSLPHHR